MEDTEIRRRIDEEEDFVDAKRFDNSLEKLMEKYPDGAPDDVIAKALALSESEVEAEYQSAIRKLRSQMGVGEEE